MDYSQWIIIVAEDEYDSLQTISMILKHNGIQLHIARNGRECLHLLQQVTPTVVILDLMMPELDGWATLAQIRADQRIAHLPVVAVTAYYSVEMMEEARLAGFDGFFNKPVSPTKFVQKLAEIVSKKRSTSEKLDNSF
mgnify:CR=1 FL=1